MYYPPPIEAAGLWLEDHADQPKTVWYRVQAKIDIIMGATSTTRHIPHLSKVSEILQAVDTAHSEELEEEAGACPSARKDRIALLDYKYK